MNTEKMNQIIRISKMHYELHYTQLEIAKKEGISKSTVSRILKSALDTGIIEVHIKESALSNNSLEQDLLSRFPIKNAVIIPNTVGNSQVLLQDICHALCNDLPRFLKNDSILGVAWGDTLSVLARNLPRIKRQNISVIQLTGGFSRAIYESSALDILRNFVNCVKGSGYQIPAPAMVDKSFIVDALKQDSQIHEVLQMAELCQTAVFSVGNMERPSVLYEMGLIEESVYNDFKSRGCVGDCCSHFLNRNGEIFDPEMDACVVGASLETIKKIPNKLVLACGTEKAEIVSAALLGGLVDHLYIDEALAEEIVRINPIKN